VAYKNAAQELVGSLSRAAGSPDGRGYAILFLYRHAIELYLKTVLYRAAKLLQLHGRMTEPWLRAHHSLPKLLAAVRPVLDSLPRKPAGITLLAETVEELINDVNAIDSGSYCFRYPITPTGEASHDRGAVVDVFVFAERVDAALDELICACIVLEEECTASVALRQTVESCLAEGGDVAQLTAAPDE